jgi:hypothetical protein
LSNEIIQLVNLSQDKISNYRTLIVCFHFYFPFFISQYFGLISQLSEQLIHILHHHSASTLSRCLDFLNLESWVNVKTQSLEYNLLNRLLLRLQDILYLCEPRSIQSEVDGEDRWQRYLNLLEAEINLTHHLGSIIFEDDLRAECCARHIHNGRENLPSLHVVIVDRLLTK